MIERNVSKDDQKREKQRKYWRERKAEQRRRQPPLQQPTEPSDEFIDLVFAEREYRLQREYKMWRHPDLGTLAYRYTQLKFSADVWAAIVVLEEKHGVGEASPTRIAEWLFLRGFDHGCSKRSLRTMVYRAFEKIDRLKSETYLPDPSEVVWPPFSMEATLARQKIGNYILYLAGITCQTIRDMPVLKLR